MPADADLGVHLDLWSRHRDGAALERLMAGAVDQAYTQARRTLGNDTDAQDATQEALIQVMRSAHRYDPSRPFAPWLARHVHFACSRLRWSTGRRRARELASAPSEAVAETDPVDREAVRAAVADLPERDRAAVELHYWAGLPQAEVARELGVSENALAVRLHRARERLRDLLARRGVVVGATALAAALLSTQAWAAPSALSAGVVTLGATALPATTIPLGVVREAAWAALRHPWWAAGAAAVLAGTIGVGVVLLQPVHPPAPPRAVQADPPPPAQPPDAWAGPEREILRWLVPTAPLRAAADVTTLRRLAATAKPTSLLFDPQARPALDRLGRLLQDLDVDARGMATGTRSFAISMMSGASGLLVSDLGPAAGQVRAMQQLRQANLQGQAESQHGVSWKSIPMAHLRDSLFVIGNGDGDLLAARTAAAGVGAPPAPELPAPAWLAADLGPLVAAYARADAIRSDPLHIGHLLGAEWRTRQPRLAVALDAEAGTWIARSRLSGAVPFSPLSLAAVGLAITSADGVPAPLPAQLLRRADPAKLPPVRPGALASLTLGSVAGWLRPLVDASTDRQLVQLRGMPGVGALIDAWSGDLAVVVEPGAPLPACSVVVGLRQALDPEAVSALVAVAGLARSEAGASTRAAWQGFTPAGMVTVLLADGRLVVSTAADATAFLGRASAPPQADLVISADLPRLAAAYAPLAYAQFRIPIATGIVLDQACLPPIPALVRHLTPWTATWDETADGCVVREKGMPVLGGPMIALVGILLTEARPEQETQQALERSELRAALVRHRERISAISRLRTQLVAGSPLGAADRMALRPFFAGREPDPAQLRGFGCRYEWPDTGPHQVTIPVGPELRKLGYAQIEDMATDAGSGSQQYGVTIGPLDWAVALGDGWSVGIIGSTVGLMRGAPPAGVSAAPPSANF